VSAAIEFDRQLCTRAIEIQKVDATRILAAEFELSETSAAKQAPEPPLSVGGLLAELAGEVAGFSGAGAVFAEVQRLPPHPGLLAPPCKAACPAGIDIRGYIELINQGNYEGALNLIQEKVPLPAVISRVCPHPCEAKCNRGELDESIAINALKRFCC
jgi:hypothetical protein